MNSISLSPVDGDLDSLIPEIYAQLKRIAGNHLKNERQNHTLSPTELVHEVYLLLQKENSLDVQNRLQFLSLASTVMRHVLVNHAKRRLRKKRGGGPAFANFDELKVNAAEPATFVEFERRQVDFIALEESLEKLFQYDPRQVKIIELNYFGGLTFEEIAGFLNLSLRTVQREWRFARNWLFHHLNKY